MNQQTLPTTDRRARQRTTVPACSANRCIQGRTACPCPQACELADATDAGHPGSELSNATSTARFILLALAAIAAAALVTELALRA